MLTDSELAWLDTKRVEPFSFCNHCWIQLAPHCAGSPQCPLTTLGIELYAAIEFEQRVAVKLANIHFGTEDCQYCSNSINVNEYCGECKTASTSKHCQDCRMKYARLEVEEEMENE